MGALVLLSLVGSPPQSRCPWDWGPPFIEMPAEALPTNSHFWIRSGEAAPVVELHPTDNPALVQLDIRARVITSTIGGYLIEAVPLTELEPETDYVLNVAQRGRVVRTGAGRDDESPPAPTLPSAGGNISPAAPCWESAVVVQIEPSSEWGLQLYEAQGELLEVGTYWQADPVLGGLAWIPAEPGRVLTFDVVTVDLAGHRSEAVGPVVAEAGFPSEHGVAGSPRDRGCACAGPPRAGSGFELSFLFALVMMRRRA